MSDHSRVPVSRFSLQIWPEDVGEGRVEWRGKVHHMASREARYFRDWPTMLTFIQSELRTLGGRRVVGDGELVHEASEMLIDASVLHPNEEASQ